MKRLLSIAMVVLLTASISVAQEPCTADFDCNGTVDADDVTEFLTQFGRSQFNNPCPYCYDSQCPCATVYSCEGTLSPLGRWCDQGDGTVKDMTNGLLWLKTAGWGGLKPWINCTTYDDAHRRVAQLWDGSPWEGGAFLSDGSVEGDWRLPTRTELYNLANGTEAVRSGSMQFFTYVQYHDYWSSTTNMSDAGAAWSVDMTNGTQVAGTKDVVNFYVWPVRGSH
jgi:hypothetical protein